MQQDNEWDEVTFPRQSNHPAPEACLHFVQLQKSAMLLWGLSVGQQCKVEKWTEVDKKFSPNLYYQTINKYKIWKVPMHSTSFSCNCSCKSFGIQLYKTLYI